MSASSKIVQDWLRRAKSDLHLGKAGMKTKDVLFEDACFHAQQCAEKALKAFLLYLDVDFPKTHTLEVLLDLLKNNGIQIPQNVDESFELSQYAVQTRYPGEWEPVTKEETQGALERAALVLHWVNTQITS